MLDLGWAEELAVLTRLDEVEVTREPTYQLDFPPFDHTTGEPTGPAWPIIYAGPAQVAPMNTQPVLRREGDEQIQTGQYAIALPLSAPEFLAEDEVRITASQRDPAAVGQVLRVIMPRYSSLQITRRCLAELRC